MPFTLANTWEQRKLKNFGESYSGLSGKTKDDFGIGNSKFITYKNIFDNEMISESQMEKVLINSSEKQNKVNISDAFFTISSETPNEVGMSSVLNFKHENLYLNSFSFGFRTNINIDNYFLANSFRSEYFRNNIVKLAQGISRYNISKNKVLNLSIKIPDFCEQTKVGLIFKSINKSIAANEFKHLFDVIYINYKNLRLFLKITFFVKR
ncbi:restriction endonuclease subunit S [Fructilactobacillus florum]|nr:restriction endonuclease subunit S [Fructilactobacillus florum]